MWPWPEPEENPRVRSLQTGRSPVRPGPASGAKSQKEIIALSHSSILVRSTTRVTAVDVAVAAPVWLCAPSTCRHRTCQGTTR